MSREQGARGPRRSGPGAFFSRLLADERGATAIEYGITVALIALVIITAVTKLGTSVNTTFSKAGSAVH